MEKIKSLTPEQEKYLDTYYNECLEIGRSITPINHDVAEKIISKFYERVGKKAPKFLYFPSPKAAIDFGKDNNAGDMLSNYYTGQQGIYWKALYKFGEHIGVKYEQKDSELLDELMEESKHLHWWFPYENYALIVERPIRLTVNESGRLHNESAMAIEYSDGWGMYYLNGVKVPEYLVMTSESELSLDFYTKEKNADVKAEFVRKFGVERMLDFGKKIDSYENYDKKENPYWHDSQYELWDMKALFEGLDYQPYLKMMNQTTKIWHVEALSPNVRNLKDAIKERFGGREMKIVGIA